MSLLTGITVGLSQLARYLERRCFTESTSDGMLHQRNHQQFSDCHAEKSEARNPKKGPEALFLCKVEQVLWQNDQILWMPELSRTNNPDCSVTPSRRCYEMLLCRPALWLFMWRDIFLSRSAIGYERIRFWFDLTRADVIQLESVPCEAMQGLFWCPCFFLFLCVCVCLAGAHVENEGKQMGASVKILR